LYRTGKEVAKFLMAAIEADGVGAQQPLLPTTKVGLRCLDHQVKVSGTSGNRPALASRFLAGFAQSFHKTMAILIVVKDVSRRSPDHEVVEDLDTELGICAAWN